jgi:two-component system KDP operon response regulator KdpE
MKKILVIEDEQSIRNLLKITLEANDYDFIEASNSKEGIQKIKTDKPDIILLDLGLPDKNGLLTIKEIRAWCKLPIIVLTVQDNDSDKVEALDGGADDYITKPFSVPELLVRIRVALRHTPLIEEPIIKCGLVEMDLTAHLVRINSNLIKLSATEFNILKVLMINKGKVVTHNVILKEVWGQNAIEHIHYLRVYLTNLRKKININDQEQNFIVTEAGVGYRLVDE